jgi:tetracycline repressor-like protein
VSSSVKVGAVGGRLFDRGLNHPYALRPAIWRAPERAALSPDAVIAASRDKIATIAVARRGGRVNDRVPAAELMVLVS